jgi:hypothetical protein
VAVSGNLAFVADGAGGLRVVDVSDPASPTEVGFYVPPGGALTVAADGKRAYVGDLSGGLSILEYAGSARVYLPLVTREK